MGIRNRAGFYKQNALYSELLDTTYLPNMTQTTYKVYSEFKQPMKFKEITNNKIRYALSELWNVSSDSMMIETQTRYNYKKGDLIYIDGAKNDISEIKTETLESNLLRNKKNVRKIYRLLIG